MSKLLPFLTLGLLLAAAPDAAMAQASASNANATTYLEFQVDKPATVKRATSPAYPARLLNARVEGEVVVQFVVTERGTADMSSFKVIRSANHEFTEAVRQAVQSTTFQPAEFGGAKVRQIVQQPFQFTIR
jgi:protein TonB